MEFLGTLVAVAFIGVIVYLFLKPSQNGSQTSDPVTPPVDLEVAPVVKPAAKLTKTALQSMTKAQLIELGRDNGANVNQKMKKADLVDTVNKALKKK